MRATQQFDFETRQWVEIDDSGSTELHYVMDDVKEFRSPDGAHIGGRTQWREHLKRTGTMEMGHSDIRNVKEKWDKRKQAFQERLHRPGAREAEPPQGEIRPMDRSRVGAEVANRLHNRPEPGRKELIKLTMETAQYLARRGR